MGENKAINFDKVPVLMVSYSNEHQLKLIFSKFNDLNGFIITSSRRKKLWGIKSTEYNCFIKDMPEIGNIKSRLEILNNLLLEIKRRTRILKDKRIDNYEKYESLNQLENIKLNRIFLMIDDIWDIVVSKPKKMSLNLIKIMLYGFKVGIHTIIASAISYRNLLQQIISYHPILINKIQRATGKHDSIMLSSLGHELIFTAENFVYYKTGNLKEMEKFYSI